MSKIDSVKDELEKLNLSSSERDEVFELLDSVKQKEDSLDSSSKILDLEKKLSEEDDWRKRASLSAQIIRDKLDSSKYYE